MFTLLHKENNGHEALYEAKAVWRDPMPKKESALGPDPNRFVYADVDGHDPLAFGTGTLYVMNAMGKTVATYHLHEEPPSTATESSR